MLLFSRKSLLALVVVCLAGCPKKPQQRDPASPLTPPEEKASITPDSPPEAPPKADPATELAPTKPAEQAAAPAAPQEAPPPECDKPKDCKSKGKPGKGMRWTCFESRCMAEPKGGLKKKRKG